MKINRIVILIILFFPIIGLNTRSVVDNLDLMKLEYTSEVSRLLSLKSTSIVQLEHDFKEIPSQQPTYQPSYQLNKISASPVSVACVLATGGLGDKSFNDMAYAGLQQAEADGLCTFVYVEPETVPELEGYVNSFAAAGTYDLVIAIGFLQLIGVNNTAITYPDQVILLIDDGVKQGNVSSTLFKEHEGSFLGGALAGLMTKTGRVGFIGGMDLPLIRKFWAGYAAGAYYERNNSYIEVFDAYVEGSQPWNDPATGKTLAENMWRQGVDIIYAAAGKSGDGVLEFASETPGVYAIGVDSDQDSLYPGDILTSMMKRIDIAVYRGIQDIYNGNWLADIKILGLAEDGVSLSPMTYTKDHIGEEIIEEVNVTVRNKIIGGEFSVPNDTIRLNQWMTDMNIVNKSYTYHVPINILGASDFLSFPGSGSPTDPYNITGLYINATSGNLIFISNTNLYFRIENCLLNGLSTTTQGINLQNVTNGAIVNTTVWNMGYDGISLGDPSASHYINITDNIIFNNGGNGIFLKYSTNNNIIKNTVFNNTNKGIRLEYSFYNYLVDNIVYDHYEDGIFFLYSDFCSADGNTVWNSGGNGIYLGYSNNSWISDNLVFENGQSGISSEYASKNAILSNEVFHNGWMGITTHYSTNHTVNYNIAKENEADGLSFYVSTDMKIINNSASENKLNGIRLELLAHNNSIIKSTIFGNGESGIWVGYASCDNNVSFNSVSYNNGSGIVFLSDYNNPPVGSNGNLISNNTVFNNQYSGIHLLTESDYNSIIENVIFTNGGTGINIDDSRNISVLNNRVHNNSGNGISLGNSTFSTIKDNAAYDNLWGGISIHTLSQNNTIIYNVVYNNFGWSGIAILSSDFNVFKNNEIFDHIEDGFLITESNNNEIIQNQVYGNTRNGFAVEQSNNNIISYNHIFECALDGFIISNSENNEFNDNIVTGNTEIGFRLYENANFNHFFSNTVNNSGASGISLVNSINNTFNENRINDNDIGIFLEISASFNWFENNTIFHNNEVGIFLMDGQSNLIIGNTIYEHQSYGLVIGSVCDGNLVKWNNFIRNNLSGESQAEDDGDSTFKENFWDEWTSPDANNDGFVDEKYILAGGAYNFDHTPLTKPRNPSRFHFISRFSISFPSGGETLVGSVKIQWTVPLDSLEHTIFFNVYYSDDGGIVWSNLTSDLDVNEYEWDTHHVPNDSNYLIKIEAYDSTGLMSVAISNTFTIQNTPTTTIVTTTTTTTTTTTVVTTTTTTTTEHSDTTTGPVSTTESTESTITPGFSSFIAILTVIGLVLARYRRTIKEIK